MGSIPVSAQQQIVDIANSAYYTEVPLETLREYQFKALLENSGYAVTKDGTAVYMGSIPSASSVGQEVVGNTAVNTKIVTDAGTGTTSLQTSEIAAGTTTTGTGLLKGAMNMKVSPVMSALVIAQACGYMYEEVEEHPEFWTDVSDALLGADETHPYGNPQALSLKNGLDVLLRARQDGGIGAYCEKEKIMRAVNTMYDKGAFNTQAEFRPQIESGGTYLVQPGGVDFNKAIGCINAPKPSTAVYESALSDFNSHLTASDNAMIVNWWTDLWQGGGTVTADIFVYEVPDNTYRNFLVSGSNISLDSALPNYKGHYTLKWDYYDGSHWQSGWATTGNATQINGTSGATSIFSSVNSEFIAPADTLIPDDTPGTVVLTDPSQLETLFASWLADGFTTDRVNPDTGENERIDWLPLNIFDYFNNPQATPGAQDDAQSGKLPGVGGDPGLLPKYIIDYLVPNINFPNFNYPENPTGDTPAAFVPSNSMSSKLYTVYNPSNGNLDSLGAYLWDASIIRQLVELFTNNPMDAIISLHQIYATPTTGSNKNIILGILDSGVSSPVVTNQYITIDCGSVAIGEIYGDARDYTQVSCDVFLPFIGLRTIDCHDVIGCTVGIKFKIDVYTGSTLAEITVTKQGVSQILYTFEGNCSVQIPLTAADRSRMIQGIVAATTGLITGGVGAMAGAAAATALGGSMQTSIQKSSAFSGNAGAMGGKVPYIVITRQKSADASNFVDFLGYPTNKGIYLKDCVGFTRVHEIHIDIPRATAIEKEMLYGILKSGIVL